MKQFEEIMKLGLKEDLKGLSLEKTRECPTELDLASYFAGSLPQKRKRAIQIHLSGCLACMEDLILAQKATQQEVKKGLGSRGFFKNWVKKNSWLILAIASFILSFIYPRYFIQFLTATLVLAAKWIFETVNARILIMIYDAWKHGGEKEVSKVLERVNNRRLDTK